jgi:hypothetical protein
VETSAFIGELFERYAADFSDSEGWRDPPDSGDFDRWLSGVVCNEVTARFDALGLELARRYHSGEYSFSFCDWVINAAYGELLGRSSPHAFSYPVLFDEIYQAFDDGEWDHHGKSDDPVRDFTKPAIAAILGRF